MMLGISAERGGKKSAPNEANGIIDQLWDVLTLSRGAAASSVGF